MLPQIAQSTSGKPVKGMLTGPVTILNWSFPRRDVTRSFQVGRTEGARDREAITKVHERVHRGHSRGLDVWRQGTHGLQELQGGRGHMSHM